MSKKTVWTIVLLVGGYVCWQLIADIGATKMVRIGTVVVPGGTFIYAVTFTWRDLMHKRLGAAWARACIVWAGVFNVVMALYLAGVGGLPAPRFSPWAEAWGSIFSLVPRIALASVLAEVVSELVDTEVYQLWVDYVSARYQWARVLASNAVSLPLDSLLFVSLAFGGLLPLASILSLAKGQMVLKGVITLVSLPGIYLVKENRIAEEVECL